MSSYTWKGLLEKMSIQEAEPVEYRLDSNGPILNQFLGKKCSIHFTGTIKCLNCGKKIKKNYGNGYCYPCFMETPENSECIIRPELCRAHEGGGRNPEWEREHHLKPHVVYLAFSGGIKVGVTRNTQIPVRWIDQGAIKALVLAETPNRYLAGVGEVSLKTVFSDKTNFRRMLGLSLIPGDSLLLEAYEKAVIHISEEIKPYLIHQPHIHNIYYPQPFPIPQKITSLGLEKNPVIEGILEGIKGQYLYFDNSRVINIRSHSGYEIEFTVA